MTAPAKATSETPSLWCELVAQSVEHVTFNHGVLGSNPSELTRASFIFRHENEKGRVSPAFVVSAKRM